MSRRNLLFVCATIAVACFLPPNSVQAGKGSSASIVRINLTPAAGLGNLKGKAKSAVKPGEAEFQVSVENARFPAGTLLTVTVDGGVVGAIAVDATGRGSINLNSKKGAAVPVIQSGTRVEVVNPSLSVILSGTF